MRSLQQLVQALSTRGRYVVFLLGQNDYYLLYAGHQLTCSSSRLMANQLTPPAAQQLQLSCICYRVRCGGQSRPQATARFYTRTISTRTFRREKPLVFFQLLAVEWFISPRCISMNLLL